MLVWANTVHMPSLFDWLNARESVCNVPRWKMEYAKKLWLSTVFSSHLSALHHSRRRAEPSSGQKGEAKRGQQTTICKYTAQHNVESAGRACLSVVVSLSLSCWWHNTGQLWRTENLCVYALSSHVCFSLLLPKIHRITVYRSCYYSQLGRGMRVLFACVF